MTETFRDLGDVVVELESTIADLKAQLEEAVAENERHEDISGQLWAADSRERALRAQLEAAERERDELRHKEEIFGGFFDEGAAPVMGWKNFRSHEQLRDALTQAEALLRQARVEVKKAACKWCYRGYRLNTAGTDHIVDGFPNPCDAVRLPLLTAIDAFLAPKEGAS